MNYSFDIFLYYDYKDHLKCIEEISIEGDFLFDE